MTEFFISLLYMSLTASCVAAAVIIIRVFLGKAPKIFSYIIWLPVLIRLVIPFSINSRFSFMGLLRLPQNAGYRGTVKIISDKINLSPVNAALQSNNTGILNDISNNIPNTIASSPTALSGTKEINFDLIFQIATVVWLVGIVVLSVYSVISYFKILRNIKTATLFKDNIYETVRISTPFVCGFLKPKIYIPTGLNEPQLTYILSHEQTHIKRLDYLIKPFSFLVVVLHWFNPIIWVSFSLMSKDMEMSCDESVLRKMGNSIKANYSNSLLSLSVKRSGLGIGSPLAFGESAIKSRIKNILNYRNPSFWLTVLIVIVTTVFIVGFATNPREITQDSESLKYKEYNIKEMLENKTPYVGDNAKVVALFDAMPLPEGLVRDTVELQTQTPPYGITINLDMEDVSSILHNGAIRGDALFPNSVLLLSLIDNVDTIKYRLSDSTGKYDGALFSFTITRKMVQSIAGEDVRNYSTNTALLGKLIDKVTKMHVGIQKDSDSIPAGGGTSSTNYKEIGTTIEQYINVITTPGASSNPGDYIKAHQKEYENILKMGNDALEYLLSLFKENKVSNDLRGNIIMSLCKDLLGERNNGTDDSLKPTEWYSRLSPNKESPLGDFRAQIQDPVEQLVYNTAVAHYSDPQRGFTVVAPTLFGSYKEEDKLKVFVTVYTSCYKLYDKTLLEEGGGIIPAAITFKKNPDGSYSLEEYTEAKDGAYFSPSIKNFCTLPVSGKQIKGLNEKILKDYSDHSRRKELLIKNIIEHLKVNKLSGISLKQADGELLPLS